MHDNANCMILKLWTFN